MWVWTGIWSSGFSIISASQINLLLKNWSCLMKNLETYFADLSKNHSKIKLICKVLKFMIWQIDPDFGSATQNSQKHVKKLLINPLKIEFSRLFLKMFLKSDPSVWTFKRLMIYYFLREIYWNEKLGKIWAFLRSKAFYLKKKKRNWENWFLLKTSESRWKYQAPPSRILRKKVE